jgi:transcription elongation factor GreA
MRAELGRLRQRLEGEFTERLRETRGFGGSLENDEYLQIKEEEAVLASRIQQLERLLASAQVVDEDDVDGGVVAIGSFVEVKDARSGAVREHRITGSFEPAGPDNVSANSPVGQALLGRSAGEQATVELPDDRAIVLEVLAVSAAAPTAPRGPA